MASNRGSFIIVALIGVQLALLYLSLTSLLQISLFCTGPRSGPDGTIFTAVHYLLLALLVMGIASIHYRKLRLAYALLLLVSLTALPFQARFVETGALQCDLP